MWTNRITSQTNEHPAPGDVFRTLLSRMIELGSESSWTHFEVIAEGGWFMNLLSGKEPWIEIAFVNRTSLQLNLGVPKQNRSLMPRIPAKWRQGGNTVWTVPMSDTDEL